MPADGLVGTFDRFCLPHVGDAAGLRAAASRAGLAPVPSDAPVAALARPGRVFRAAADDAPGGAHGSAPAALLLSLDSGLCGVTGGPVDSDALLASFAGAMAARGIAVAALGDAPDGAPQAYGLSGRGLHATVMVDIRGERNEAATVSLLATPGDGS